MVEIYITSRSAGICVLLIGLLDVREIALINSWLIDARERVIARTSSAITRQWLIIISGQEAKLKRSWSLLLYRGLELVILVNMAI